MSTAEGQQNPAIDTFSWPDLQTLGFAFSFETWTHKVPEILEFSIIQSPGASKVHHPNILILAVFLYCKNTIVLSPNVAISGPGGTLSKTDICGLVVQCRCFVSLSLSFLRFVS